MIEINKIYNMDCLEGMKQLSDDSIDLIITDPPYGVRKEEWDDRENFINQIQEWLQECLRVSKNGVVWFCADKMMPYILRGRKEFHRILFWNKPPGSQFNGASNNNIWYSVEPILIFEKGDLRKKGKKSKQSYSFFNSRTHKFDDFKHPTAKPYLLMQWLLEHYSEEGEIILDPFVGSGTTLRACKNLGRKYIGFEISPEYCKIAEERLKQEVLSFT